MASVDSSWISWGVGVFILKPLKWTLSSVLGDSKMPEEEEVLIYVEILKVTLIHICGSDIVNKLERQIFFLGAFGKISFLFKKDLPLFPLFHCCTLFLKSLPGGTCLPSNTKLFLEPSNLNKSFPTIFF